MQARVQDFALFRPRYKRADMTIFLSTVGPGMTVRVFLLNPVPSCTRSNPSQQGRGEMGGWQSRLWGVRKPFQRLGPWSFHRTFCLRGFYTEKPNENLPRRYSTELFKHESSTAEEREGVLLARGGAGGGRLIL